MLTQTSRGFRSMFKGQGLSAHEQMRLHQFADHLDSLRNGQGHMMRAYAKAKPTDAFTKERQEQFIAEARRWQETGEVPSSIMLAIRSAKATDAAV